MDSTLVTIMGTVEMRRANPDPASFEVVNKPKIDVDLLFMDAFSPTPNLTQILGAGDYGFLLEENYGIGDPENEEFFFASMIEEFKKLGLEAKARLAEEWVEVVMSAPGMPGNRGEYLRALYKGMVIHGAQPIIERPTFEESIALRFLEEYGRQREELIIDHFVEGRFDEFVKTYSDRLTALYVNYSISVRALQRTIDQLPELAGRRFIGLEGSASVILPLKYDYMFARDDLLQSGNEDVSIKMHSDTLQIRPYEMIIMESLRENGIIPGEIKDREGFYDFHNQRVKHYYQSNVASVVQSAFAHILNIVGVLGHFAEQYDRNLLRTRVALQFSTEEIAYISQQCGTIEPDENLTGRLVGHISNVAAAKGYLFPRTQEAADKIISDIKSS